MKPRTLLITGLFLLMGSTTLLHAQSTGKLDTAVADGYLAIIIPSYNNFQQLLKMDITQFAGSMTGHNYVMDNEEAINTYKIESFKSTYTIHKSDYEVEFYLSSISGFLSSLKTDMKKLFPKAKHTGEGTGDEIFEYETRDASGVHSYTLTISSHNSEKVYISLMQF
ncbi:MAG TPA: hypothetical protein VIV35_02735 [Chitinophagaceae bacterium]